MAFRFPTVWLLPFTLLELLRCIAAPASRKTEKATEARHRLERQYNACANRKKHCYRCVFVIIVLIRVRCAVSLRVSENSDGRVAMAVAWFSYELELILSSTLWLFPFTLFKLFLSFHPIRCRERILPSCVHML